MNIEPLESRIAPAAVFAYTDTDGDNVTLTVSKGTDADLLAAGVLTFSDPDAADPRFLRKLDLSLNAATFAGANITLAVKRAPLGDGLAAVGYIDASAAGGGTALDLGTLTIKGDLGEIDAGDDTFSTPGVKALSVHSIGRFRVVTQGAGADFNCIINGPLGSLKVTTDFNQVSLLVFDAGSGENARIGSLFIGGSLTAGNIGARHMPSVKIVGDVVGGTATNTGRIGGFGESSLTIGGSVIGGAGDYSGFVSGSKIKIGGSVVGGSGFESGSVHNVASGTNVKFLSIGGSLIGSTGIQSGFIRVEGELGKLTIKGDVIGSTGLTSGAIQVVENAGTIIIAGSVRGGAGGESDPGRGGSGSILVHGDLGALKIGRDFAGGSAAEAGRMIVEGDVGSVSIGGSVLGGGGTHSGTLAFGKDAGMIQVRGSVLGANGSGSGAITNTNIAGTVKGITIGGALAGGLGGGSGDLFILGALGPVKIAHDLLGGDGTNSGEIRSSTSIASVTIGGSVRGGEGSGSGRIIGSAAAATIGAVKIAGDLIGGPTADTGRIVTPATIASVTIGGSMIGGAGNDTGNVVATGDIGPVKVTRDVIGGGGNLSGRISSSDVLTSVTIGGSLIGGVGVGSGIISGGENDATPGDTFALGPVTIAGDVIGGSGVDSARIGTDGPLASLTVGGSVIGVSFGSGQVIAGGDMGAVKIAGDLKGGSIGPGEPDLLFSGYIQGQRIASVFIGGSIIAGIDKSNSGALLLNASIRAVNDIGAIVIKGGLIGNTTAEGTAPVIISARGQAVLGATSDVAIKSLSIGRHVEFSRVLAGYTVALGAANEDASIGAVSVGGNWIASDLVAGAISGGNGFGDADDAPIAIDADALVARIASIAIKGAVFGTEKFAGDHFGFVAQQIGAFKAAGFSAPLTAGTNTFELAPTTADIIYPLGDVTLREV